MTDTRRAAHAVIAIILAGTGLRVILGALLGLGVDESYTVTISRQLSASYFDHPPVSFWIPGLLLRLGVHSGLLLRLPFIALFAGTTWVLYRLTARYWGERAGLYAALLLNVAPVFSLSTGGWILPDGPLDFAMIACVACVARIVLMPGVERPTRWWLGAGALAGVAFLSKYHAAFLVLGLLLFLLTERSARHWLARPGPYLAAAVALLFLAPVVAWNVQHQWASFRFQGGRGIPHHGPHLTPLIQNVAGQAGYLLPWLWLPLVWQLVSAIRAGPADRPRWLMACMAIGPIALFTSIALGGNPGLPHWPAPGYLFLFPLLGAAAAHWEERRPRRAHRWTAAAIGAFLLLVAFAASQIATGWVGRLRPDFFRRGDPSLEALNWSGLAGQLAVLEPAGWHPAFVAAVHWIDAAKIGYALGPDVPVLCLSDDSRHFAFLYPRRAFQGRDGLLIVRLRPGAKQPSLPAGSAWLGTATVRRAGEAVIVLSVYRIRLSEENAEALARNT